ncbi:TPA: ribonuclease HI family protein [Candidatus Woesearchaeota archaeon]|nr:ribonuclease HI family protein [Candidatus Woesearchaeota archaeon]
MPEKILINCDGGARRNPGPAAIGVGIWDEAKNKLEEYKECIGDTTSNVAEYKALIKALELAVKHTRKEVHIFMDSELVIKKLNGMYRIKAKHLFPLFQEVKKCEQAFSKVVYNNVTRNNRYQVEADRLVNEALEGG